MKSPTQEVLGLNAKQQECLQWAYAKGLSATKTRDLFGSIVSATTIRKCWYNPPSWLTDAHRAEIPSIIISWARELKDGGKTHAEIAENSASRKHMMLQQSLSKHECLIMIYQMQSRRCSVNAQQNPVLFGEKDSEETETEELLRSHTVRALTQQEKMYVRGALNECAFLHVSHAETKKGRRENSTTTI